MAEFNFICACCNSKTIPPEDKRRTDFLICDCSINPLICGPCRNERYTNHICLWCRRSGLARSTRSFQHGSYLKDVVKKWETFRTDYPFLSPLSENWCNFAIYHQFMQRIKSFTN